MPHAPKADLDRAAIAVHGDMKRGLSSLASVAATAPFVGFFGTVLGILNSFRGVGTEKSTVLAMIAESLSESLVLTELGLLVALLAFCGHQYFLAQLESLDVEMKNASLKLINELGPAS
jgi:biopolymer transport protein ExbB/TolQ